MLREILTMLRRQLVVLAAVAAVALATYVSIGREFMPAVSSYKPEVERVLSRLTGLPIAIASLEGDFEGFSPVISVAGLRLASGAADLANQAGQASLTNQADLADRADLANQANPTDQTDQAGHDGDGNGDGNGDRDGDGAAANALVVGSTRVKINPFKTLWNRGWVLDEFTMDGFAMALTETAAGHWQVGDMAGNGLPAVDLEAIYRAFRLVSRLEINDLTITARPATGPVVELRRGEAVVRNQGGRHFLHLDGMLGDTDEPVRASLEIRGARLATASGRLHLTLPAADYADIANLTLTNLTRANPAPASPTLANSTLSDPTAANRTPPSPALADSAPSDPTSPSPTLADSTHSGPTAASPTLADSTHSDPTAASPALADSAPSDPDAANPTPPSPALANSTPSGPTAASPTLANSAPSDPTAASPTPADSTPSDPAAANPVSAKRRHFTSLRAQGSFWLELANGRVNTLTATGAVPSLALALGSGSPPGSGTQQTPRLQQEPGEPDDSVPGAVNGSQQTQHSRQERAGSGDGVPKAVNGSQQTPRPRHDPAGPSDSVTGVANGSQQTLRSQQEPGEPGDKATGAGSNLRQTQHSRQERAGSGDGVPKAVNGSQQTPRPRHDPAGPSDSVTGATNGSQQTQHPQQQPGEPVNTVTGAGSGTLRAQRLTGDEGWRLLVNDANIRYGEHGLTDFSVNADYRPGHSLSLAASHLDLNLLATLAADSGLLADPAVESLRQVAPAGTLRWLEAVIPLADDGGESLLARANIAAGQFSSLRGSPQLAGVTGYLEARYNPATRLGSGRVEVESDNFRINIPTVFTRTWEYDYVNGALDFSVDLRDGSELRLASEVVTARSRAVDAKIQFTSVVNAPPDRPRRAELELLVGAERVDSAYRALYLPDGPTIGDAVREAMEWLDRGLLDGEVHDAGVLFRGLTNDDAPDNSSTFQSFYRLRNGSLRFSPDWPDLTEVTANVMTDDGNVDIRMPRARSRGVTATDTVAVVRPGADGGSEVHVLGTPTASLAAGLDFLSHAPVGGTLRQTLADWQGSGEVSADLDLRVPLNAPSARPRTVIDFHLGDSAVTTPELELAIADLNGSFSFDSARGLTSKALKGTFFGEPTQFGIHGTTDNGDLGDITVTAQGAATPAALMAWPRQSAFVRALLRHAEGQLAFAARLDMSQDAAAEVPVRLTVDSALAGTALNFPAPFGKPAAGELPLHLDMAFARDGQSVRGHLGPELHFDLRLAPDRGPRGLLLAGSSQRDSLDALAAAASYGVTEGVTALGEIDAVDLAEWSRFLSAMAAGTGGGARPFHYAELNIGSLRVQDVALPEVRLRLPTADGDSEDTRWVLDLAGESVQGRVVLPAPGSPSEPMRIDLEWLRLPGDDIAELPDANGHVLAGNGEAALPQPDDEAAELPDAAGQVLASGRGVAPRLPGDKSGELPDANGHVLAGEGEAALPQPDDKAGELPDAAGQLLAGASEPALAQAAAVPSERRDPLANLDPRTLPAMQFATREFMIGERDYGSWAFTLIPTAAGVELTDLRFDFRGLRLGLDGAAGTGAESFPPRPADQEPHDPEATAASATKMPDFAWHFDGRQHRSMLRGTLHADDVAELLIANGFAASLDSERARFDLAFEWPGTPAHFSGDHLSGTVDFEIENGRFQRGSSGAGALRLISILNFDAIMRRLRFSDDLLRRGLAFDDIHGQLHLDNGVAHIEDRIVISGPSSVYQITGDVNLAAETIMGEMYVTLPLGDNIPWVGLLTANFPLAIGAFLIGQIFGKQMDSLTSAVYTLEGPWQGLAPKFKQAFGSPPDDETHQEAAHGREAGEDGDIRQVGTINAAPSDYHAGATGGAMPIAEPGGPLGNL